MKAIKKLFSLLMIATLLFSLGVTAFATSEGTGVAGTATNESTATIHVTTGNEGDILNAYTVFSAEIGADNVLRYTPSTAFTSFIAATPKYQGITADAVAAYEDDSVELKTLLGDFAAYLKADDTTVTVDYTSTTVTAAGTAEFTNVKLGYYIILGSGNTNGAYIYQIVTAEVIPFAQDNEWKTYPEYNLAMKVSQPDGKKEIAGGVESTTASIGDDIDFVLSIDVPVYPAGATNTTFYIRDTMSSGLTLNESFVVKGYTGDSDTTGTELPAGGNTHSVVVDGQTFTINFDYSKVKQYTKLTVEYSAKLNENAVLGTPGNVNNMEYIYSNDPYGDSDYTIEDETYVITFGLAVNKYDKNDRTKKLSGAKFAIYDNSECEGTPIATITTDANGYAQHSGLDAGIYYVKETKAPSGYKLLADPIEIIVAEDGANFGTVTDGVAAAGENDASNGGVVVLDIANTKGISLPSTGGVGTTIFYIIGSVLAVGAAVLLITKKRLSSQK